MADLSAGIEFGGNYKNWISEISMRFKASQIKASIKVNDEMLRFYWGLGRDIEMLKKNVSWGSHIYQKISKDLVEELPEIKSFSPRNLQYMNQFYRLYSDIEIAHQLDAQVFINEIAPQVGAQIDKNIIFMIPWGNHKVIMDKCKEDQQKALFFVQRTLENKWSRAVLLNFLDTQLYDRQGKAITNFELTLPDARSDLAQEITKDPYNFDFITLTQNYNEKELKDALMDNIADFLLELGNGFAFVGREYRIEIGNTENFIDMLFYNIKLHCYVVVEVKVTAFDPAFTGQLGTYVVAVNHSLKSDMDAPTLGLLVCKSKDNVQAKYAIEASSQPLGISEYELSNLIPDNFKGTLPTIEEIEAELSEQKYDFQKEEVNNNISKTQPRDYKLGL